MPWLQPSPLSTITLDQVMSGITCDPITLADFEAYLQYKEHTVENLQFVIWYQSYRARFSNQPPAAQALSPGPAEFTFNAPDAARTARRVQESKHKYETLQLHNLRTASVGLQTPAPVTTTGGGGTPPVSPISPISTGSKPYQDHSTNSGDVKHDPGQYLPTVHPLHREFLDTQPLRTECAAVLKTFIVCGAPKELSLSDEMREMAVRDSAWNTHPDVFLPVYEQIYDTLSTQSLPAFLKLSATNVNFPKALYWYAFGIAYMIFTVIIFTCLVVKGPRGIHQRAWRCFSIPFSSLGAMLLWSGWKGLCTEVWSRGRTQLRPWDLQLTDDHEEEKAHENGPHTNPDLEAQRRRPNEGRDGAHTAGKTSTASSTVNFPASDKNVTTGTSSDGDSTQDGSGASSIAVRGAAPRRTLLTSGLANSVTSAADAPHQRQLSAAYHPRFAFEEQKSDVSITARPTMFGPERPLLDPRIRKVHALIVRDMLLVGIVWTTIWVAIICSVPTRK